MTIKRMKAALADRVLGFAKVVADKFQRAEPVEIGNRENALKDGLQIIVPFFYF